MRIILTAAFLLTSTFLLNAQPPSIGLVAYYPFENSLSDVTGNTANLGAASGNPYYTCGVEGEAISLNGQADEITILGGPVNDEFDLEDVSISLYFKPRGGNGQQYILSKRSPSCFGGNEFFLRYVPQTRTINCVFRETDNISAEVFTQLENTSCWQHVGIVRESGRLRLFVNGELVAVDGTPNRVDIENDGDLIIGDSDCKSALEFPFNGVIDELRVYSRALDEQEMRSLYYLAPDQIEKDGQVTNVFLGNSIDISVTNTCATNFSWTPTDDVSDPSSLTPTITPSVKGEIVYTIALLDTVTSCIATDSILINVIDPNDLDCNAIFLPSAFTPNDDGLNDTYGISNPFAVQDFLAFDIFDRWGNKVFSAETPFDRWDGSYKDQAVNPGVMKYVLQYICEGEEEILTGTISILR
ncbi:MAG: gliding motility-associated C-terminal domain-containing protein [Chitinophagales bacterium]|nr:gliding motility-associated C-terminal domain-containing protein [Chitinophagales bacterium]